MVMPTVEQSEAQTLKESFNEHIVVWVDTGKKDKKGRKILRNLDTTQEQVFKDD